MKALDYDQLVKTAASRPLTPNEDAQLQQFFAAKACSREDWELDVAIEKSFQRLPAPALSSNFTAQVLAAARLEQAQQPRAGSRWKGLFRWKWSPAMATLLLLGLFMVENHRENVLRAEVARSIAIFREVATALSEPPMPDDPRYSNISPPIPTFEVLQNFESIKRLNVVSEKVDKELLDLLATVQ